MQIAFVVYVKLQLNFVFATCRIRQIATRHCCKGSAGFTGETTYFTPTSPLLHSYFTSCFTPYALQSYVRNTLLHSLLDSLLHYALTCLPAADHTSLPNSPHTSPPTSLRTSLPTSLPTAPPTYFTLHFTPYFTPYFTPDCTTYFTPTSPPASLILHSLYHCPGPLLASPPTSLLLHADFAPYFTPTSFGFVWAVLGWGLFTPWVGLVMVSLGFALVVLVWVGLG